jgi:hypothetical protein
LPIRLDQLFSGVWRRYPRKTISSAGGRRLE